MEPQRVEATTVLQQGLHFPGSSSSERREKREERREKREERREKREERREKREEITKKAARDPQID